MREDRPSLHPPTVDAGQIWVVEQDSASALSAVDRDALTHADVVIYDRALAPLVAEILPIGGYAEPAEITGQATGSTISPRAVELAGEGWSVVRLVEAGPGRRQRLHILPPALVRANGIGDPPVRVIAKTGGERYHAVDVGLHELPEFLGEIGGDELLTLVFAPVVIRSAAQAHAFTANGLAG
jgi:hypothetical protein